MDKRKISNKQLLSQYAGMTFQLIAMLGLAVYIGFWVDKKLPLGIPLFIWILPLIILIVLLIKTLRDTKY